MSVRRGLLEGLESISKSSRAGIVRLHDGHDPEQSPNCPENHGCVLERRELTS